MSLRYKNLKFYFNNEEIDEIAGIYQIRNLINNKIYIGSTNDLNNRWIEHKKSLNRNNHSSIALQRAWNKYGKSNFIFEPLEFCYKFSCFALRTIEQRYIDELKPEYNMSKLAFVSIPSEDGLKRRILALSKEYTILKPDSTEVTISSLREFCNKFNLNYNSMGEVVRGRIFSHQGYRIKYKESEFYYPKKEKKERKCFEYFILYPNGTEIFCKNLNKFCKENNLQHGNLRKCALGMLYSSQGFRCRFSTSSDYVFNSTMQEGRTITIEKISKSFIVQFPDGHEENVKNLAKFARNNNLEVSSLRHVALGECGQSKGFKVRYANENEFRFKPRLRDFAAKKYKIIFPNNSEKIIKNLTKFCEENKLNYGTLRRNCLENNQKYKNYMVYELPN